MVDLVKIAIEAGSGGSGAVSFSKEKYKPKGPPDGGGGVKVGDIYFVADRNLSTLYDFRRQPHFKAENGKRGGKNNKKGKNGKDVFLKVPVGTEIKVKVKSEKLKVTSELLKHGEKCLIALGGSGGRGNSRLRTRVDPAPKYAEEGQKGEKKG